MKTSDSSLSPLTKVGLTPRDQYRVTPPNGRTLKIAHITDTHLGLREKNVYIPTGIGTKQVRKSVSSFAKFQGLITTLQTLEPDVIIHTGDLIDNRLQHNWDQFRELQSNLSYFNNKPLFLYIRGNHDRSLNRVELNNLFRGCEILPLEKSSPVTLANSQFSIYGRDYRENPNKEKLQINSSKNTDSIMVGVFHQSVRRISSSYDAEISLEDLSPDGESTTEYYDLLLFGHMHTNSLSKAEECMLIDGGSTLGLDAGSSIGLLTFSEAGSHYQRFPLWVEDH